MLYNVEHPWFFINNIKCLQGVSHENVKEEEWNQTERNEVFLRYNVYNTPLSPIPEESSFDDNDELATGENTPK